MDTFLLAGTSAGSMATRTNSTTATSVQLLGLASSRTTGTASPSSLSSTSSNPSLPSAALAAPASTGSDVDAQILEALRSKDRIYVLKLGEQFESLIKDRSSGRTRVELTPATTYQRLLVHRCAAYYRLQPDSDPVTKALHVLSTSESRIPERRICELVPAEATNQPAFKIMKRDPDRRKPHSHAGSIAGEDADLSDVEPSEAGSLGGQSNITSSSTKKRMTIEQREAAYNEARSRIFMGFEDKEKGKDKDMSASSSSLSVSGSTSTSAGGRSSVGDTDDVVSSPATESEWSTPSGPFVRDRRRGGGSAGASSTRSLRSGGSFHGNGSGSSSRNSRAASPSFSYASLYEPPPSGHSYDGAHHSAPPIYHHQPYNYQYPPATAGPNPSFVPSYPYYNPGHPYQSPPPTQPHNPSDPSSPAAPDAYSAPHSMIYDPHYGWHPMQAPPQPMHMSVPQLPQQPPQPQSLGPHPTGPVQHPSHIPPPGQPSHTPSYSPYGMPPQHAYSYPVGQYYPQHPGLAPAVQHPPHSVPPQVMQPPPPHQLMGMHPQSQPPPQVRPVYDPRNMNPSPMAHLPNSDYGGFNAGGTPGVRNALGNGILPGSNNVRSSVNGNNSGSNMNKRVPQHLPPPANTRSAWSYGPGVSIGGFPAAMAPGGNNTSNDSVGPRFNSNGSNRRASNRSNSGANSRASSNCDDVSSIASSSTTSSSSRRTYTSTTSSQQHPLPPRPDWAVGIKAQPSLAGRHHDQHSISNSRTMSPISPTRSLDQNSSANNSGNSSLSNTNNNNSPRQPSSAGFSSPSDFPPLTSGPQEKKGPIATGAWGTSRPVLSPILNGNPVPPAAIASSNVPQSPRAGPSEDGKIGELHTPKLARHPAPGTQLPSRSPGAVATVLVGQVATMSLEEGAADNFTSSTQPSRTAVLPSTVG